MYDSDGVSMSIKKPSTVTEDRTNATIPSNVFSLEAKSFEVSTEINLQIQDNLSRFTGDFRY